MEYISKSQLVMIIKSKLQLIEDLEWSEIVPKENFNLIGEGILVLFNANKQPIYVSATNNFGQRLSDLLFKENTNNRFKDVQFVQVAYIDTRNQRFSDRGNYKDTLSIIRTSFEDIANVIDDDDPKILAINREIAELRQQALRVSPSYKME